MPLFDANLVRARFAIIAHLNDRRRRSSWVLPIALRAFPVAKPQIRAVPFVTIGATVRRPSNEPPD